jgi:hypothetical protein
MPLEHDDAGEVAAPRLSALPIEQVATLLRHAGSQQISVDTIRADLAAGAPANRDGTINLVVYAAWLARELARREKAHG